MKMIGIIATVLYMLISTKLILNFIMEQEKEDDKKTD